MDLSGEESVAPLGFLVPDYLTFVAVCQVPRDDGPLVLAPPGHIGYPTILKNNLSLALSFQMCSCISYHRALLV